MILNPTMPLWQPPSLRLPPLWRPMRPRVPRRRFAAIRDWLGFDLAAGSDGMPTRRSDGIPATNCSSGLNCCNRYGISNHVGWNVTYSGIGPCMTIGTCYTIPGGGGSTIMDHYEITATSCLVLGTWQGTYPAAFSDYYPTPSVFDVHGRNFGTDDCSGDSAPFSFTTAFFTITYGDADPANNFAWLYGDVGTYFYVDGHAWDPTVANITLANAHPCPGGITYDGQGGTITIGRFTC